MRILDWLTRIGSGTKPSAQIKTTPDRSWLDRPFPEPKLVCSGCKKTYAIGEDAVAVSYEATIKKAGALIFAGDERIIHNDLVGCLSRASENLDSMKAEARQYWSIINDHFRKNAQQHEPKKNRNWECVECHKINRYPHLRIHEMALYNDIDEVRDLLDNYPELELAASYDSDGWTPLHYAVRMNNKTVVQLLLALGAEVNIAARDGDTPLHVAAHYADTDVIARLLEHNAEVNFKGGWDASTAFHTAAYWGRHELVQLLLPKMIEVDCRDKYKKTPLHHVAKHRIGPPLGGLPPNDFGQFKEVAWRRGS